MKLLITDLDGTLLMKGGAVHDDDLRAAKALRAHGIHLSIATGRLYSGSKSYCRALELFGPVGCADGSQLVDATDDRSLALHALPAASVEWLLAVDAIPFVFADDSVHHDSRGVELLHYVKTWSDQTFAYADLAAVTALREPERVKVVLLLGVEEPVRAAQARAAAGGLTALCFQFNGIWGLVVRQGGIDKGTAIEFIARHHGVPLEDVAVVGDWLNDVPMLRRAGHRFVMGHAPEEVRVHAQHVLPTAAPGGRAIALIAEHFGVPL